MKAPVIAGTPHGKDVLMAHLSDAVIYQGSQSPANYPVLVVYCQGYCSARCTPSFKNVHEHNLNASAVVIVVVVGLTMAKADRINPQVGAPKSLTPLICLGLSY